MKKRPNPRREVAEAALVLANELPARTVKHETRSNMLIDTAKRLQRMQSRRARVRKELKALDHDIRYAKRELRALVAVIGRGE
jgi:hypothetical protein